MPSLPPRLTHRLPQFLRSAAFWSAAALSFVVHWTLLVARLPASRVGLAVWVAGDLALLAFSLQDRRWAQAAGLVAGLVACGAGWALWLDYAASLPGGAVELGGLLPRAFLPFVLR